MKFRWLRGNSQCFPMFETDKDFDRFERIFGGGCYAGYCPIVPNNILYQIGGGYWTSFALPS